MKKELSEKEKEIVLSHIKRYDFEFIKSFEKLIVREKKEAQKEILIELQNQKHTLVLSSLFIDEFVKKKLKEIKE